MASGQLHLPLPDTGTPFRVVGGYHDALPPDDAPRRSAVLEMDLPSGTSQVSPNTVWPGLLRFQALQLPTDFDPLATGFVVEGDLVLKQSVPTRMDLQFWLNEVATSLGPVDRVALPTLMIYRNLRLTAGYLTDTLLPMLMKALNAAGISDSQDTSLRLETDLLRAFVRGEAMVEVPRDMGRFILPSLSPDAQNPAAVRVEIACGRIAGDDSSSSHLAGSDHPGFVPFPLEYFYQLVTERHLGLLVPGEAQHPLLQVLTAQKPTHTVRAIPELYLPEIQERVEDCFPQGLPTTTSLGWRYTWVGADNLARSAPIPADGRFYSGEAPGGYRIHEPAGAGSSARLLSVLAPREPVPSTLPSGSANPVVLPSLSGTLVIRNSTLEPELEWIRQWILYHRGIYNKNNPVRTDVYRSVWTRHPELPWSLLANLVSRNAGYQMSDFVRYRYWLAAGGVLAQNVLSLLGVASVTAADQLLVLLFAFTEAGNYLIFRDVFPQLSAYRFAKQVSQQTGRDISAQLFTMLTEPEFGVDPVTATEWQMFFAEAQQNGWWAGETAIATVAPVARLNVMLIVNEQNHIEERLVNDRSNRYLGKMQGTLTEFIEKLTLWQQGTLLAFVMGASPSDPAPTELLLYALGDFTSLDNRIETGRDLYSGIFLFDATRRGRVQAWASASANHRGSRADYDPLSFDTDGLSSLPLGKKFSPLLVEDIYGPYGWPLTPGLDTRFRHIHTEPRRLPPWSGMLPSTKIESWRAVSPKDPFTTLALGVGRPLEELPSGLNV